MTDIDFDELDRAVNSLMQQHKESNPESEDQSSQQVTGQLLGSVNAVENNSPAPSPKPNLTMQNNSSSATPPASNTQTPVQSVPAIKRSSGRFMDVVHPSSDMINNHPPKFRTSRTGVSVNPTNSANLNTETTVAQQDYRPPVPEQPETNSVENNTPAELPNQIDNSDTTNQSPAPLESPFVEGAVVEKRPLGAVNDPEENSDDKEILVKQTAIQPLHDIEIDQPEPQAEAETTTEDTATPAEDSNDKGLAPELSSDLMALESTDPSETIDQTEDAPIEETLDLPTENSADYSYQSSDTSSFRINTEIDSQMTETVKSAPAKSPNPITPTIGDIPQQYTADPDSEPEPVPMFEAASQSPELSHKEKKKSGWLTVLLILLFLIIGAAGGAAAWYFLL